MKELSKSILRRTSDMRFGTKYFVGEGVDIGGKPDPLSLYAHCFPLIKNVRIWDLEDGDAQFMKDVDDETFDFLHSSHCLEHLNDPYEGIKNWIRVIKPGGHLIIKIPDEDMYEQETFPSDFNDDHKWTFTISKTNSWSSRSINCFDLLSQFSSLINVIKIELLDHCYNKSITRYDQTMFMSVESAIEFIIQKKENTIIKKDPDMSLWPYYNQCKLDKKNLKKANQEIVPFSVKNELL